MNFVGGEYQSRVRWVFGGNPRPTKLLENQPRANHTCLPTLRPLHIWNGCRAASSSDLLLCCLCCRNISCVKIVVLLPTLQWLCHDGVVRRSWERLVAPLHGVGTKAAQVRSLRATNSHSSAECWIHDRFRIHHTPVAGSKDCFGRWCWCRRDLDHVQRASIINFLARPFVCRCSAKWRIRRVLEASRIQPCMHSCNATGHICGWRKLHAVDAGLVRFAAGKLQSSRPRSEQNSHGILAVFHLRRCQLASPRETFACRRLWNNAMIGPLL